MDLDGLIGIIIIMELKGNVGESMQIPMAYISKQKTEKDSLMGHGAEPSQMSA